MTNFRLVSRMERDAGMSLLADLTRTMYRLNVTDHRPLVTYSQDPDSVYRLLGETASAVCRQLGWDPVTALEVLASGEMTVSEYGKQIGEFDNEKGSTR